MTKKYDLCVKTGTYTDKNGETKSSWENIGIMIENDNGPFILLKSHFNPAGISHEEGRSSILVSMFAQKENTEILPALNEKTIRFNKRAAGLSEAIPF